MMGIGRSSEKSVVFVVDDDDAMRAAVGRLIRSVGLDVVLLASAREFLTQELPAAPCCLVLDVRLPGMGGLDFQTELAKAGIRIPIVFMSAFGDVPMTVKAMRAGALEFLTKPFRDQDLIDAVQTGLERDEKRRKQDCVVSALRSRYETLSPREREVMTFVTQGLLNKQVATKMGIAENTVKLHRGNLTEKMGVKSLAELVRVADLLGVHGPRA